MRQVGELILLAAPSCCGKTHFLSELFAGRLHDVVMAMKLEAPIESYLSVIPREIANIDESTIPRMILHFALPTIALNDGSLQNLANDPRLEVVNHSDRVIVVTLLTRSCVLTSRLRARYRSSRKLIFRKFSKYLSERRRMRKLTQLYAEPSNVLVAYDAWFAYSDSLTNIKNECIVTANDNYEVFERRQWQQIRNSYFINSEMVSSAISQE